MGFNAAPKSSHLLKMTYQFSIAALYHFTSAANKRDPEMHQTRKGRQCYFGMKLHIGVDSVTSLAHSAVVTAVAARHSGD